jgi:EmrB/QacA subfamily drug resistance transporter
MKGRLSQRTLVLLVVCTAQCIVVLDGTVVNVALPSIQHDLGFTRESLQWVINAYVLTFGGCLLLGGRAADLLGRRRVLMAGVILFTLASLACGLAGSPGWLIAARAVQGLGAAIVSPAALSVITSTFPEGPERNRALSVWATIASAAAALGVLVGGVITTTLGWEWVFYINVPVGAVAVIAGLRVLPETRDESAGTSYDVAGAATVTIGLSLLVYAIVRANSLGWTSAATIGLFVPAVALLALFTQIERRARSPLLPLAVFRLRSLSAANGVQLVIGGALTASFYFLALYFQQVLGYTALETGLAYLPLTGGMIVAAALAAKAVARLGVVPVLTSGLAIVAAALLLLAQLTPTGSFVPDVLPAMLVFAVGLGLTWVPVTIAAMQGVPQRYAGLASGLYNTSYQVGGALGLAILSAVAAWRTARIFAAGRASAPQSAVDGYRLAFYVSAAAIIVTALLIVPLFRPGRSEDDEAAPRSGAVAPALEG